MSKASENFRTVEIAGEIAIDKFDACGKYIIGINGISLRRVSEDDRIRFLELQKENTLVPYVFERESFQQEIWEEHASFPTLACSILCEGEYVGDCGIRDVTKTDWEISIEILPY